jgi:hypothetical protein
MSRGSSTAVCTRKNMTEAEKEDWRLQGVVTVLDVPPNARITTRPGNALKICFPVEKDGGIIAVGLPNASALYLDYAYRLHGQAIDLYREAEEKVSKSYVPDKLAFAFFQKIMGAIVFSFSAIETFANAEIPDDHMHFRKWREIYIARSKTTIERWEPLDAKLGEIIPEILKIPSPKSTKTWQDYTRVKDLRDRVVHLKTEDQKALATNPNSIWRQMWTPSVECFAITAKGIIGDYYTRCAKPPRWFSKVPF